MEKSTSETGKGGSTLNETREETLARERAFLNQMPQDQDPLSLRIHAAMGNEDEPKPPRPRSEMTLTELGLWEIGNPKNLEIRLTRSAVWSLLYNWMAQGEVTEAQFQALLAQCKTHASRLKLLTEIYQDALVAG